MQPKLEPDFSVDQFVAQLDGDAAGRQRVLDAIARADRQRYFAYRAAGFTEEQAFQFALKAAKGA